MSAYEKLARDIAREHRGSIRTIDDFELDNAGLATCLRDYPEMVGDALAGHDISFLVEGKLEYMGSYIRQALRTHAKRCLLKDVLLEQSDLAQFEEAS